MKNARTGQRRSTGNGNFKQPNLRSNQPNRTRYDSRRPLQPIDPGRILVASRLAHGAFAEEESSISARMASRSSEAEITGKSRTSAHPRASRHCSEVTLRTNRDPPLRRHSQYAGSASSSHAN